MNALRRDRDGKDWTRLPASGRSGDVPEWPLPPDVTTEAELEIARKRAQTLRDDWMEADGRQAAGLAKKLDKAERDVAVLEARAKHAAAQELEMWQRLWRTPQALVWAADGVEDMVAMYVRTFIEASAPGAAANMRQLAKQYAEALLLSVQALHAARYVIVEDDGTPTADAPATAAATGTDTPAPRRRRGGLSVAPEPDADDA